MIKTQIRVVSSREEIPGLSPSEKIVHLAFRPSNKDIFGLIDTCPKIEVIQLPKSYRRSVSGAIVMFLDMQKIKLIEGDVWGHRKYINQYYEISEKTLDKIKELKGVGKSGADIEFQLGKSSKLSGEMINYIADNLT